VSELARAGRAAPPIRLAHLGLGNFFRAHQAVYTAADEGWGYAAFSGRSAELAGKLDAQGGCSTLITRGDTADRFDVIGSVVRAHAAADHAAWLGYLRDPRVGAVTLTVTEAAYLRAADGALDRAAVAGDLAALRADRSAPVSSVPARIVAGLAARHAAGAGPIAVVPCDNLPDNGPTVRRVVLDLAEAVSPELREHLAASTSFVTTMVDRITPRPTDADVQAVLAATGRRDECPVVTEPFTEWVLAGEFPAGRPAWDAAGATFTDDVGPFEQRKLWLLNGAHSLLAYAGSIRGHQTVAEAIADPACRGWVEQWWDAAASHLSQPQPEIAAYRAALLERFGNRAIAHRLEQIAADGSQKLPIRVLPVLDRERAAGRVPHGATRILAAWIAHLRGHGAPVTDAAAAQVVDLAAGPLPVAVAAVLEYLQPGLATDRDVVQAVLAQTTEFEPN
jgi:fructuronate reductase